MEFTERSLMDPQSVLSWTPFEMHWNYDIVASHDIIYDIIVCDIIYDIMPRVYDIIYMPWYMISYMIS